MAIVGKEGPVSKLLVKRTADQQIVEPSPLDQTVAKALYDLQAASTDLGPELSVLQIYGARQVDMPDGKKCLVLLVPVPQLKAWRKIQLKATRELEKKFPDQTVLMVAHRRITSPPKRGQQVTQRRPWTRTLTAVYEAWLEDMVYPTEIVGRRLRVKTDGSRISKVLLDAKDKSALEGKVDAFVAVYKKLTGRSVVFEFATPINPAAAIAAASKSA